MGDIGEVSDVSRSLRIDNMFKTLEDITESVLNPEEHAANLQRRYYSIMEQEARRMYTVLKLTKTLWDGYMSELTVNIAELEASLTSGGTDLVRRVSAVKRQVVVLLYYFKKLRELLPGSDGVDIPLSVDPGVNLFNVPGVSPRSAESYLQELLLKLERHNVKVASTMKRVVSAKRDGLDTANVELKRSGHNHTSKIRDAVFKDFEDLTNIMTRSLGRGTMIDPATVRARPDAGELLDWDPTVPLLPAPQKPVIAKTMRMATPETDLRRASGAGGHPMEQNISG
jgi:hypothetical protein